MSETLQEFLVKIKYQTDKTSETQALSGVKNAGAALLKLGAAAVAVGGAIASSTLKYAQGMNSTYLATQRMGMGIKQMRAMSKAAEELGGSVGDMQSSMNGFASFMRRNPFGSVGFLAGMGVKVGKGESKDVTLNKIAKRFQVMPEYMAIQYGEQMGMSESTVLSMRDPKFQGLQAQHMAAMGKGDFQAAGKQANEVIKSYDLMVDHFDAAMTKGMMPALNAAPTAIDKVSQAIDELDPRLVATATAFSSISGALAGLGAGLLALGAGKSLVKDVAKGGAARAGAGLLGRLSLGIGLMLHSDDLNTGEDDIMAKRQADWRKKKALIASPEMNQLLDGIRYAESRGNPNAVSPAGAQGAYQFMPKTSKSLGVNPFDEQASRGAAGGMMGRLLGKYKGNTELALQAYNWGEGNVDSYLKTGRGAKGQLMPQETKDYPGRVEAGMLHSTTTINVHGVNDPKAAAEYVAQAQTRVNQQNARNQQGAHR